MAIIGGAGNPVGGSFTGPAEALEIAGNHCYAYSGKVTDAGTGAANATMLSFTSGNYLADVKLYFLTNINDNRDTFIDVTMNGTSIYKGQWDEAPSSRPQGGPLVGLIIPAYTEIVVKWGCSATKIATLALTGRIFRPRD